MTPALALLALAAAVVVVSQRVLPGAGWVRRAPRLGVLAWQSASACVVGSVVLAGLVLAVPILPATGDVAGLLGACAFLVRDHYASPGGVAVGVAGLGVALAVLVRAGYVLAGETRAVRRARRRQREGLGLAAHRDVVPGAWVVDDDRPAVFCIPGTRPRVVLTSAALHALTPRQRELALAHEHAHLSGRHHLALGTATALRRAFAPLRFFAVAADEIATLVEMHADDRAARAGRRSGDRRELAVALVRLAEGPRPAGTMGAGGAALQRVQRLVGADAALPATRRCSATAGSAALVLTPLLIALAPALDSAFLHYCAAALHA